MGKLKDGLSVGRTTEGKEEVATGKMSMLRGFISVHEQISWPGRNRPFGFFIFYLGFVSRRSNSWVIREVIILIPGVDSSMLIEKLDT